MQTPYRQVLLLLGIFALLDVTTVRAAEDLPTLKTDSIETIQGRIVELKTLPVSKDSLGGVEILVRTSSDEYRVVVGPTLLKGFNKLGLSPGDEMMTVGVSVNFGKRPKILQAREIRRYNGSH